MIINSSTTTISSSSNLHLNANTIFGGSIQAQQTLIFGLYQFQDFGSGMRINSSSNTITGINRFFSTNSNQILVYGNDTITPVDFNLLGDITISGAINGISNLTLTAANGSSGGNVVITPGTGSVTQDGSIQLVTNVTPLTSSPTPVTVTGGGFSLIKVTGSSATTLNPTTTINSRQGVMVFDDSISPIPPLTGLSIQVFNNTLIPAPPPLPPFISNDQVMCCVSGWATGGGTPPAFTFPQPSITVGGINQPGLNFTVNIFNTDPVNSLSNVSILFMLI